MALPASFATAQTALNTAKTDLQTARATDIGQYNGGTTAEGLQVAAADRAIQAVDEAIALLAKVRTYP